MRPSLCNHAASFSAALKLRSSRGRRFIRRCHRFSQMEPGWAKRQNICENLHCNSSKSSFLARNPTVRRPRLPICAHLCHLRIKSLRLRIHRPMSSTDQKAPEIQLPPHFTHPRPIRRSQPPTLKFSEEIPRARFSPTRIPATLRIGFAPTLAFAAALCFTQPNAHGEDPVEAKARNTPSLATPSAAPKATRGRHRPFDRTPRSRFDGVTPQAETDLGLAYINEKDGVRRNPERAFELFTSAALQRFSDAEYCLYEIYKRGAGVAHNDALALDWCIKAAKDGSAQAEEALGDACQEGLLGIPVNKKKPGATIGKRLSMVFLRRCRACPSVILPEPGERSIRTRR